MEEPAHYGFDRTHQVGKERPENSRKLLKEKRAGLAGRDLLIIDVSGAGKKLENAVRVPVEEAEFLRRRLSIGNDPSVFDTSAFGVIGGDGN